MDLNILEQLNQILNTQYDGNFDKLSSELKSKLQELNKKEKREFTKAIIEIKGITKTFKLKGETIHALKNINLEVFEGEMVSIMGPSGSGKSTLLNMLAGLDTPTEGEISVLGSLLSKKGLDGLAEYRNKTIGMVFQFFNLQSYFNVKQNIAMPIILGGEKIENNTQKIEDAAKSVGLGERLNHKPSQLSGGQMQRVAIARALINNPQILLADEPTGNLDKKTGQDVMDLLKRINKERKTTIILVTHDTNVALQTDRVIKLSDGMTV